MTVTLEKYLNDDIQKINKIREKNPDKTIGYFIHALFPDGSCVTLKHKFSNSVFVPKDKIQYRNNIVERVEHIYDDFGGGTYIFVGNEKGDSNATGQ